jgi:hypothetical protein
MLYSRREHFLRNLSSLGVSTGKPLWYEINIAWGNAPGNPSYAHVEYLLKKKLTDVIFSDANKIPY